MYKALKASSASKGSKASKALVQNIELQITQIVSGMDNSENVLHDGNDIGGEAKKQKKISAKLSKLNFGGGGAAAEKAEEKLAEVGTDEERRLTESMELEIHCPM
jgi:hypothetical protein